MANENNTKDRELLISRVMNAPRTLVYEVWTSREHMPHWWGPNGFKSTIHEMDVKVGGVARYTMHGPDGTDYPNIMKYEEVIPNKKLVYLHSDDEQDVDVSFHVTTTFEDEGDKTRITMRMVFPTAEERDRVVEEFGADDGNTQTMMRLEDYLTFFEADSTFTISRVFDAPLQLLYDVHTQKEHILNYWGPKESDTEIIEFDFRTGGRLFYRMGMPQGDSYGQQLYREIVANKRLTMFTTFCNEQGEAIRHPMSDTWPIYMLNSMDFEAVDENRTKLTIKGVPYNATAAEHQTFLEGHKSMEGGYDGTLKVLEAYLKTLTK